VTVHNLLGQEVDSRRQYLFPGFYRITWKNQGSAGVYFYTIHNHDQTITRKMIQLDGGHQGGLSPILGSAAPQHIALQRPSSLPLTIIYSKFAYVSDTLNLDIVGGETFETFLETIHNQAILVDLHNDILEIMLDDTGYHFMPKHDYHDTDIPRLILGGVDIQFFAVWISPNAYPVNQFQKAQEAIGLFNREMNLYPDYIRQARSADEALAIAHEGKIAAVLAVEGGHVIENDISKLISFYDAGMRYLTLTWNNSTDWAVSASDSRSSTVGLSDFGKRVIRTLDSLGVIIDVSHVGIKTIEDVLEITGNPIIATHSGVRAIQNSSRNLYDKQIQAIAASGGVIGIVFYPPFLKSGRTATVEDLVKHIDYIVNLVGIDYVAIGSDYDGIGSNKVNGMKDVSQFPNLTFALLQHGYSKSDVRKILGGNFLRVFRQVCTD